jgi:protoporphyrinogen oxidase
MSATEFRFHTAVVGGGFSGLAAAYELAKSGKKVVVLERDRELGGLAGGFEVGGHVIEKFYHHWFNNDKQIIGLIEELDATDNILLRPTRTGMYYADQFFRLSTPMDLLRFRALPFLDRIRLGISVLRARAIKDWRPLESLTAREWLTDLCGKRAFEVVWEPLLVGKFGNLADEISAVWFWKKLVLRGGSRNGSGDEVLAYYKGGFAALAERLGEEIVALGGTIMRSTTATGVLVFPDGQARGLSTDAGEVIADNLLLSTPLPVTADLLEGVVGEEYIAKLRRIRYLSNVCLVLSLDRSLSDTYWLNVNDPSFPFVGVIEHTNFEPPTSYGGRHIVYLSKYLPPDHEMYTMADEALLEFSIPHLKKMFPDFDRSWIREWHAWRADSAQPIAERHYSQLVPPRATPIPNVFITTMAQVYPEDRGTNYAVREGKEVAATILAQDA